MYSIPALRNQGSVTGSMAAKSFATAVSLRRASIRSVPAVMVMRVPPVAAALTVLAVVSLLDGGATVSREVSGPQAAATAMATAAAASARVCFMHVVDA